MRTNFFALTILAVVAVFAFFTVGGIFPTKLNTTGAQSGSFVMVTPVPGTSNKALQFKFITFKGCSSTTTVDFLVDRSGSMAGNKLKQLQQGILSFVNKLSDQSVFGLQTFADPPNTEWRNDINPGLFSDVKGKITDIVCSLNANGGTYTKDAFTQTKDVLVQTQKNYSGRKLALIFVSDGVPETNESDSLPCTGRLCRANTCECFAPEQDPTSVADEIKAMGIKIYTIAYVDQNDANVNDKLQALMKGVASTPDDYYMAPKETDVVAILNKISNEICADQ